MGSWLNSLNIETYSNLSKSQLKELHNYYMQKTKKSSDKSDQNIFIWSQEHVTIYFIANGTSSFAFATHVVNQTNDYSKFIRLPQELSNSLEYETAISLKDKIGLLVRDGVLKLDHNESVIKPSFIGVFMTAKNFIESWVQAEYILANKSLNRVAKDLVTIDSLKIHQSKFEFREMLSNIDDEQFKAEFDEFLFGYNNEKFFLAASSLGSIIEHLMYLTLNNYSEAKSLGSRNPTAKNYLSAFEKSKHIRFNDRDSSYFDNVFKMRNSFSHFNTGYALKSQCDMMLLGLTSLYRRFYLPSKVYRVKK